MLTIKLEHLNIQPEHRILDLGCGEGRHAISAYLLSNAQHTIGVDINLNDVKTALKRLQEFRAPTESKQCDFIAADGYQLPFGDHSFDHIICSEVLEHIPEYEKMLNEIKRVLKPRGTLSISVPRAWPERICWGLSKAYHQVEGGHIRIFKANQLKQQIERLSFESNKKHWAHALHTPYWWLRCLFWRDDPQIFIVRWYHAILVWDLLKKPWLTQKLEQALNPIIGKSVVMYFTKKENESCETD